MISTANNRDRNQTREYKRAESVVFLKTREEWGGLSNMAGGFPLKVNGIPIRSSEALYQSCRFPHMPHVQRLIFGQKSPMSAKMVTKPHRTNSPPGLEQSQSTDYALGTAGQTGAELG